MWAAGVSLLLGTGCEAMGGASVEGTEIYGFVGGAWHGLPPLWCHVTACHPIGLGAVNERRAPWAGALSLPSKAPDCFLFPASSRTRRSGVALISLCLSVPALPGLDLTIHLRRLCGISQRRRRRVEDWRCFERSSRWNWLCFFQSFDRNENTLVCLLVVVPTPLTVWRHGCHSTPTHHNESQRGPSERLSARARQPAPRPWGSREGSSTRLRSTLV